MGSVPLMYQGSKYAPGPMVEIPTPPPPPSFISAEIGTVNASTVVVTFDQSVAASENDFASGVTIKVNGVATSISGGIRQTDHAVIWYGIPVLWHGSGDTVTWEYNSGTGVIIAESGSAALGDVSAQAVTNNCEYAALLDLQADTLALNDGDPVSTWADQSGQGHDFTQTGTARPTKQTGVEFSSPGYPVIVFDGVNDSLVGSNFADDMSSCDILIIGSDISNDYAPTIAKIPSRTANPTTGWSVEGYMTIIRIRNSDNLSTTTNEDVYNQYPSLATYEMENKNILHIYVQGSNVNEVRNSAEAPFNYSNNEIVRIGTLGDLSIFSQILLHCILLIYPKCSAANRAALEARLAARYGITL